MNINIKKVILSNKFLNIIFILSSIVALTLDQVSKFIINQQHESIFPISIIPNIFYISRITNTGAAFGMFQGQINIFIFISIIAIIMIIILRIKMNFKSLLYNLGMGFVLGGAVGNLIDRIVHREVTDFINITFYAVFNIADSFIVIGFGIIIFIIIRSFIKKDFLKEIG